MIQDASGESLANGSEPTRPVPAGHQILSGPPHAEMYMTAVPHAFRFYFGRERSAEVVTPANGTDRAANKDGGVGGVDRGLGRNGQLKLASGVLGMELLDLDPLRDERPDDLAEVVRDAVARRAGATPRRGPTGSRCR